VRRRIGSALLAGVIALALAACGDENLVLQVAPERVDCVGVGPRMCLLVRESHQADWQYFYDDIAGFDFESGYSWTLLVSRSNAEQPIAADASSVRWKLIRVLSKTRDAGG
jgi:hypothetical protein